MKKNSNTPYNDDFCWYLEYHLGRTFKKSDRTDIRGFWCDGVKCETVSEADLNKIHKIETKAWIGKDGQDEYEMTIEFGKLSLEKFSKGEDLKDTVPSEDSMEWVDIDTDKRTIQVRLK